MENLNISNIIMIPNKSSHYHLGQFCFDSSQHNIIMHAAEVIYYVSSATSGLSGRYHRNYV